MGDDEWGFLCKLNLPLGLRALPNSLLTLQIVSRYLKAVADVHPIRFYSDPQLPIDPIQLPPSGILGELAIGIVPHQPIQSRAPTVALQ